MSTPTLDREAFAGWLRSLPPEMNVGRPGCSADCPLARYLRQGGHPLARVYEREWLRSLNAGDGWHAVPGWATAFIVALDEQYASPGIVRRTGPPVTAAQALAVLEGLP